MSFDLPEEWIAQSVTPDDGTMAGALKVEVKKPDGTVIASLRTDCRRRLRNARRRPPALHRDQQRARGPAGTGRRGYHRPACGVRVIQGYRYFGSFGITNIVGGADGQACELRNVVRGPAGKGDYSFGDLPALKAFAPDEKVAPAKALDTLDQAEKYVDEGTEFANVQRMLMSLEIKN